MAQKDTSNQVEFNITVCPTNTRMTINHITYQTHTHTITYTQWIELQCVEDFHYSFSDRVQTRRVKLYAGLSSNAKTSKECNHKQPICRVNSIWNREYRHKQSNEL